MSPDSACYISIAENISKGNGFVIYDLQPVAAWPPLYPLLLTPGSLTSLDIEIWARLLNALLFGLIVFLTARWLYYKVSNFWLASVGVVAVLFAVPLIHIAKHAWSETLFLLFVLLFLMRLEKSFPKHTVRDAIVLGLLTTLAVLTRYIGVTLLIFYFIWLFLLEMKLREKIIRAAAFSAISLTPLLFWMWRNQAATGTYLGQRGGASSSFFNNLVHFSDSVSSWFLPETFHPEVRVIAVGVLIILAIAWYFRKNLADIVKNGFSQILLVNWGFLLVYAGYLLFASSLVAFDVITHRMTSPIYIPLVVSVIFAVAQTRKFHISLKIVGSLIIVAWLYYLGHTAYFEIKNAVNSGAGGYSSDYWQRMEFPKELAANFQSGNLYSNLPDALYLLADLSTSISPQKYIYRSDDPAVGEIDKLNDKLKNGEKVYLAWFVGPERDFLYSPDELEHFFLIRTINSQAVRNLYELSEKPPAN